MLAGSGQLAGKSSVQVLTCPPPSSEVIAWQGIFGFIFADLGVLWQEKITDPLLPAWGLGSGHICPGSVEVGRIVYMGRIFKGGIVNEMRRLWDTLSKGRIVLELSFGDTSSWNFKKLAEILSSVAMTPFSTESPQYLCNCFKEK